MNINIGGTKKWSSVAPEYRRLWCVMDIAGKPDIHYDINSEKLFPLIDNSVDNYFSSMTLEHIEPQILPFFLKELYRTLKPEGKIRIIVPDIKIAIKKYLLNATKGGVFRPLYYPNTSLGLLMAYFYTPKKKGRDGHSTVFDWETLVYVFNQAGFKNVKRKMHGECSKIFKGLDFQRYEKHGLYMEVIK